MYSLTSSKFSFIPFRMANKNFMFALSTRFLAPSPFPGGQVFLMNLFKFFVRFENISSVAFLRASSPSITSSLSCAPLISSLSFNL